jgi:hypothetical protein
MKLRASWGTLLLTVTVTAALGGACSATRTNTFTGVGGGGGDAVGTGTLAGTGGLFMTTGSGPSDAGMDQSSPTVCGTSCTNAGGVCQSNTCILGDNPGGLDPTTKTKLEAGGAADPLFKFLYPYDRTVFARGLLPPSLQFGGAAMDGAYVHVTFPGFDYKGFYGSSSPPRLQFSPAVWKALTLSATGKADVKVEVTKIAGGQVHGPVSETWTIATGSLRGTIYYETYDSQIAGGLGSVGIMKIQPGASAPTVIKSGCGNVCHTASADGSTLVAGEGFFASSASYDLKNNAAVIRHEPSNHFIYGALTPDGSTLISATGYRTWLPDVSALYDTHTGAKIAAPGWDNVIKNPGTPAFSPDGTKIAFNHFDADSGGHTLAVMDSNLGTKTFSNLVHIATDPGMVLAWPAFVPDTTGVVYHAGSNAQFETDSGAKGDLFWSDLAMHKVHRLDALNGYQGAGTYLPASDPALNFAPTVLPEAVGGYFWVVFTSHRSYGNTLPSQDNGDQNGKLWVAAFDIGAAPGTDPSHPAFYLDGQEANADNLRGFWVLDPCKADGSDCASGDECCEGYCTQVGASMQCSPGTGGCSHELDKCSTSADCCDPGAVCINSKCAHLPPK